MRVCILGLGLIGTSLARAWARKGQGLVDGFDLSEASRTFVSEQGWAKVHPKASRAASEAELIVLATPVPAYAELIPSILPALRPNAVITDVGSMKVAAVESVESVLPQEVPFVPAHPIAGLERKGPQHSRPDLFDGHWCVLTPKNEEGCEVVTRFWEGVGMRVARLTPSVHDEVLGFTSHLPHLLSFGMAGAAAELEDEEGQPLMRFSAGSFRDFTRIARSDPSLWADILLANAQNLKTAYDLLKNQVEPVLDALTAGDRDAARAMLTKQNQAFVDRLAAEVNP